MDPLWAVALGNRINPIANSDIRDYGPIKSSDFARAHKGPASWWGWKDEKRWLKTWFALGEPRTQTRPL
jgi:uncharacterized protein YcaQ